MPCKATDVILFFYVSGCYFAGDSLYSNTYTDRGSTPTNGSLFLKSIMQVNSSHKMDSSYSSAASLLAPPPPALPPGLQVFQRAAPAVAGSSTVISAALHTADRHRSDHASGLLVASTASPCLVLEPSHRLCSQPTLAVAFRAAATCSSAPPPLAGPAWTSPHCPALQTISQIWCWSGHFWPGSGLEEAEFWPLLHVPGNWQGF